MARPIVDALKERFRQNHPIAAAVAEGVRNAVASSEAPRVVGEVQEAIIRDPVAVNELSLERPTESRTGMASIGSIITGTSTLLASLGALLTQAAELDGIARWIFIVTSLLGAGTAGSGLYGAFGRWRAGLPPMYRRLWNPLSWFARRKEEVLAEPAA